MTEWALLYNPHAGGVNARKIADLQSILAGLGINVNAHASQYAGHLITLVKQIKGVERVLVMGGDGSINEVVNGLIGNSLPLAVIPSGTANVLAREIGIDDSWRNYVRGLPTCIIQKVHPGLVNGRCFMLMAGFGFDAEVVAAVHLGMKRVLKSGAYLLAGARQWMRAQHDSFSVKLQHAPESEVSEALFLQKSLAINCEQVDLQPSPIEATSWTIFCRSRHYGGPPVLHTQAGLTQPWLGTVLVPPNMLSRFIWSHLVIGGRWLGTRGPIKRSLPQQTHRTAHHMQVYRGEVYSKNPIPCQVDGEWLGRARRWKVSIHPQAISLCIPSYQSKKMGLS